MFQSEIWFAWFPVATQQGGVAWLTRVVRERSVTKAHATPWRYYHLTTTGA